MTLSSGISLFTLSDLPKLHTIMFKNAKSALTGDSRFFNKQLINTFTSYSNVLIMRSSWICFSFIIPLDLPVLSSIRCEGYQCNCFTCIGHVILTGKEMNFLSSGRYSYSSKKKYLCWQICILFDSWCSSQK